jgi:hypothetical protein
MSSIQTQKNARSVWKEVLTATLGGGTAGAVAMVFQVLMLMWIRTIMNFQHKTGMTITEAAAHLYKEGGIPRFYKGLSFALLQAPLSRFGDTGATTGFASLFAAIEGTSGKQVPIFLRTAFASVFAAVWRTLILPIDAFKTTLQVDGDKGWDLLQKKIQQNGVTCLFDGAVSVYIASVVGHYPWFLAYGILQRNIPPAPKNSQVLTLIRNAFIGFCSSFVSDCVSNSIRVIKTYKQTSEENLTYMQVIQRITAKGGVIGLLTRGLLTKIITNGFSAMIFTVLWRFFEDLILSYRTQKTIKNA